jgi:hypothetical protein
LMKAIDFAAAISRTEKCGFHIGRKLTRDPAPERLHFRSMGKL